MLLQVVGAAALKRPDRLADHVKYYIPIPVLSPGNGKTKTGRLWVYVRADRPWADAAPPAVWFEYSPDRKGERPLGHLKDYRGMLRPAPKFELRGTATAQAPDFPRNPSNSISE